MCNGIKLLRADLLGFSLRISLCILSILGMSLSVVHAQETPFDRLDIHVRPVQNLANDNAFFRFWRPGYGAELSVQTPFYLGRAELGFAWHKYNVDNPIVPPMQAIHMFTGWSYPITIGRAELAGGFRLGNYRMIFDDKNTSFRSELDESEFTTSLFADISIPIGTTWGISGGISRSTVYTYNRLYYNYVGAGVFLRLKTGERFQRVFE